MVVVRPQRLNLGVCVMLQSAGLWAKDLSAYDVVITTYEVLRKDLRMSSSWVQSPLLHCQWWRVILDEAQVHHCSRCCFLL